MTNLCVIAPPCDPFAALYGDTVFLQADWVKAVTGVTVEVFREQQGRNKYIILDNQHPVDSSHVEGRASADDLVDTAKRLRVDEIIIPDVLHDAYATLQSVDAFLKLYIDIEYEYNLMFVPQGADLDDWAWCLKRFYDLSYSDKVHAIGIPKWLGDDRWKAIDLVPVEYQIHFLGCANGWADIEGHPRIRSLDTSLMYAAAQQSLLLEEIGKNDKPTLLLDRPANLGCLTKNIRFARSLLREERVHDGD